ncbi:unnamed protein product [Didymodactylos carnosus]|uniref:Uncharacterized protein n=1 Tax=Didymodactylos carnosus TaxID=1234261 RepID=A0A813RLZ4_9BILA|nr:unnamed protein product [Didymodactylos carnosus]CAF0786268.1 unnamed protein product [Didymodactylos carnosus]CAF3566694.1 unnamed protein product [Didymodactylos carnosus]CAF3568483.1 unnamed protein product [Didymodactylos carnosus]
MSSETKTIKCVCVGDGTVGFEYIRSISYSNTDVFLVCYSVMSPSSFTNAQKVWIPEIRRSNPKTPFVSVDNNSRALKFSDDNIGEVLVGTKIDLRRNEEEIEKLAKSKMKSISREQGEKMAKEFHAYAYIECSALTQENLEQTFHNAISATIERNKKKTSKQLPCCNCALL